MKPKRYPFALIFFIGIVGNIFEHYDKHLFRFLAPFLTPLFFPNMSLVTGLILTYGMLPLGMLAKPLGAFIFGRIGDLKGRKEALSLSLIGMACVSFLMGCIPSFQKVGIIAPCLFAFAYFFQNLFAAGETTGGALFILENCKPKLKNFFSSLYDASSLVGILLASCIVTLLSHLGGVEKYWRLLYWGGAVTAVVGIFTRKAFLQYTPAPQNTAENNLSTFSLLWKHRLAFFALILTFGFSHMIFESITSLVNGYIPLISPITQIKALHINTILLLLDLCLLPLFGWITLRIPKEKIMLFAALFICCFALPFFHLMPHKQWIFPICTLFVLVGCAFSAPLYAWAQEITPNKERYTLISLGTTIGSQIFGGGTCFYSLWLFKQTRWHISPAFYLMLVAALTTLVLLLSTRFLKKSYVPLLSAEEKSPSV